MEKSEKRQIPNSLKILLTVDANLTETFVRLLETFLPRKQWKLYYKLLEISCHGLPWLAGIFICIWAFNIKNLYQMQVNLIIGLIIDIIVISVIKSITRRRRPSTDNDLLLVGPDKYSFPSGHASRATFLVYFFLHLWSISSIFTPALLVWSFFVCMSRLMMRRHHILDVLVGILVGIFEGLLLGYIYLEQKTCINLISWITNN